MIIAACLSLCLNFWFSFSNSAIRRAEGSGFCSFGPRFFGERASRVPLSAWRCHVVRLDEYNPSRRRRAPICPGSLQNSASRSIRRLYSAVNLRRTGFSVTSEAESILSPRGLLGSAIEEIPVVLRTPSISSSLTLSLVNITAFFFITDSPSHPLL